MPDQIFGFPMHAIPVPDSVANGGDLVAEFEGLLTDGARKNIVEHGELVPVIGLLGRNMHPDAPDGYCVYVMMINDFMDSEQGKNLLSTMLPQLAEKFGAFAFAMLCEAWTVDRSVSEAEAVRFTGRLKEHPDAIEVLSVMVETRQRNALRTYLIERDEAGEVTGLGADTSAGKGEPGPAQGRFANILKPLPGGVN